MKAIRSAKVLLAATIVIICMLMAASYAAQRSDNSYEVVVGPQKSDMQRMIEAYERLSTQYLTLVQDNLAMMADHDARILEKLTALEKKVDLLNQRLDSMNQVSAAKAPAIQPAPASEQSTAADVKY